MAGDGGRVRLLDMIGSQVRPVGSGLSYRDTVPVKLFSAVTVIVEEAVWPVFTLDGDAAVMLKSGGGAVVTVTVTVFVAWDNVSLVPVTVTV